MIELPEYSVLMPLFHRDNPEWFGIALESMLDQTHMPSEVVLMHEYDLGGELLSVVEGARGRHPGVDIRCEFDPSLAGKGLGAVLAAGVERCSREYVARMDTDDISLPDRCELQLRAFEADPGLSLVGGWIDEFEDDSGEVVSARRVPETLAEIRRFAIVRNPFNHPAVMFRRDSVLSVGNYAALPRCEDYDLWVRMLSVGQRAMNIQRALVLYRTSEEQRLRRKDRKAYDIRREIKRGMFARGEMGRVDFVKTMLLDFANYHAPMALFAWGTKHLLRSKSGGKR